MRLFVTGSTGFIGSHFLRAALAAGHDVVALRYPGSQPIIQTPDSNHLTWIDGDLNSFLTDGSACQRFSISDSSSAEPAEQLATRHPPVELNGGEVERLRGSPFVRFLPFRIPHFEFPNQPCPVSSIH